MLDPNTWRTIHWPAEQKPMLVVVVDTEAEFEAIRDAMAALGTEAITCTHWARGGAGAEDLARAVVSRIEAGTAAYRPLYPLEMTVPSLASWLMLSAM